MKSVVLKGTQNGFQIILDDSGSFEDIENEFEGLLNHLINGKDYDEKKKDVF